MAKEDVGYPRRTPRRLGGNPNPTPRATPIANLGQQNTGPTTRIEALAQAQQEDGTQCPTKVDGDKSGPKKRSRLMQMVWKLRKRGF